MSLGNAAFAAMASQADGKLVFAANGGGTPNVVVSRLMPNGTADTTFGTSGTSRFAFGAGADEAVAALIQGDGKLVVVGNAVNENKVGLLRLTSIGTLDASFTGGKVLTGVDASVRAARLADDGSIYVLTNPGYALSVSKVLSSGQVDSSFGTGGSVTIPISTFPTAFRLIAYDIVTSATKVVISCVVQRAQGANSTVGIATLTRTGQGAPVLGETDVANVSQSSIPLVVRSDGTAIVAFNSLASGSERMTLYGFSPDGKNPGGLQMLSGIVSSDDDVPFAMVEDDSHRMLVAGQLYVPPYKFRVLRHVPLGGRDSFFGPTATGVAETLVGEQSRARSILIQKDRRIVLGGDRTVVSASTPAFTRYWP